ncbi:MAG: STAS domain-containing protein [Verrucomicrobiota bacterium]
MASPSANLSVLVGSNFACVKIAGRANFASSPDFKTLIEELRQKGYGHFIVDLSECVLMDSTFLGVLAQFGLKLNAPNGAGQPGIELSNPNTRVTELLENLGALHLFKTLAGELVLPADVTSCTPESIHPTHEQITRTSLEAHQTLMAVNPDNVARFKDVTQFLAEDLQNLQKCKQP